MILPAVYLANEDLVAKITEKHKTQTEWKQSKAKVDAMVLLRGLDEFGSCAFAVEVIYNLMIKMALISLANAFTESSVSMHFIS